MYKRYSHIHFCPCGVAYDPVNEFSCTRPCLEKGGRRIAGHTAVGPGVGEHTTRLTVCEFDPNAKRRTVRLLLQTVDIAAKGAYDSRRTFHALRFQTYVPLVDSNIQKVRHTANEANTTYLPIFDDVCVYLVFMFSISMDEGNY